MSASRKACANEGESRRRKDQEQSDQGEIGRDRSQFVTQEWGLGNNALGERGLLRRPGWVYLTSKCIGALRVF